MGKRILELIKGVDNVELFYDLVFVYCISVITGVAHHHGAEFAQIANYASYLLPLLVILQIWFYTTLLMNRYGAKSAADYACLFVNMFLLYYMASAIGGTTQADYRVFDISWALILVNLMVHWLIKRFRYSNIDEDDKRIIDRTVIVLALQLVFVVAAAIIGGGTGRYVAIGALVFGMGAWTQGKVYRRKPSRFAHVTERCVLLVIVTFGEMVVAISAYMQANGDFFFPILVFALVVGLFLIYNYEYDNMLDHHVDTDGMGFMTLNAVIVLIISNLTVALEFMPDDDISYIPKSIYLMVCLVLYLLMSFFLKRYSKPLFRASTRYTVGRLVACALIVIAALLTKFDAHITLVVDVIAVYAALYHEWFLFHARKWVAGEAEQRGITRETIEEAGYDLDTAKGRSILQRDIAAEIRRQRKEK